MEKSNLDGSDGFCITITIKEKMNLQCQDVKWKLFFLDSRINVLKYRDLLNTQKLCFRQIAGRNFILQQDNAPIHTA